jgi:glycosyltransferase involved in cell wall biosynthesis
MALNSSSEPHSAIKLLAVSFFYPPYAYPRSVQVARLLRHTDASTVLVCADEEGGRKDQTLEPGAEDFLKECLRVPFSVPNWRRQISRVASRFELPLWNRAPDQYRNWKPQAVRSIEDFLRHKRYRPDVLVTFGQPMSDHLIGLELWRRYGWPWAAHFSDPWVDNPFGRFDSLTKNFNAALERKVVETASMLIFTSQETLELIMKKYRPEHHSKARVLPHSFDPRWNAAASRPMESKITVRHLGELYGHRSPKPLFDALHLIHSSAPESLGDVRFELIGATEESVLRDSGFHQLPEGLVVIKPTVGYRESLSLMAASDGLLVIDAPMERSVFLPSKLIDYVGAARPILGITPQGTSATLIRQLGGWVAEPSDIKSIAQVLAEFLSSLRLGRATGSALWGDAVVRNRYEAPVVGANFRNLLAELINQS